MSRSARPPRRRPVALTVRLPRHVYDAAWRTAYREGQTIAALVRSLLVPYIKDELRRGE